MENLQPITIHLHLINGLTRVFYQDDPELIATICNDLDGRVFTQPNLIIESKENAVAFAGHTLMGISILTDQIPNSISMRENMSRTVVTQITEENFLQLGHQDRPKVEGRRSNILSEIVFVSGEHLYLEFSEVAIGGMGERAEMHNLFTNPSLACHRLGGGFSLWNTAQMVSWSHSPKLATPGNSWSAEEVAEPTDLPAKIYSML
jgi:hypothetical protein